MFRFSVLLLLLLVTVRADVIERDVCILGSGASAMLTLSEAYLRGYSVQAFEKEATIGGYCNTFPIPAPPGGENWLDIGVQDFGNTALMNQLGFGTWNFDFKAWAESFMPSGSVFTYDLTNVGTNHNYLVDLALGIQIPAPPANQTALRIAIGTLFALVSRYPWLDSPVYPDPIPPELLVSFDQYIVTHNLQAASPLLQPLVFIGGLGHYSQVTTVYALRTLRRGILMMFLFANSTVGIKGGCGALYDAVRARVGYDKILTNAIVTDISRHEDLGETDDDDGGHTPDSRVFIQVKVNGHHDSYSCGKLFMGFAPIVENLNFMHLDATEKAVFSKLNSRYYYALETNISGPADLIGGFNVLMIDPMQPDFLPAFPTITALQRGLPYGPAPGWLSANENLPLSNVTEIIKAQLAKIPASVLTNTSLIRVVPHVPFQPYFSVSDLGTSPTPYTQMTNLQGYRDTYWLGAALTYAESVMVMEHAWRIVNATLPYKMR